VASVSREDNYLQVFESIVAGKYMDLKRPKA
jgi:hypothetical protein